MDLVYLELHHYQVDGGDGVGYNKLNQENNIVLKEDTRR